VTYDDNPLTGTNMEITNSEISRYGDDTKNIFYDYIPFDYLYTDETEPQVIVEVNDMPALCKNLECGYTYEEPTAELTAMTVTGSDVEITGTTLPTELVSVYIGMTPCTVASNDDTTISCTLDNDVVFGTHYPEVRDEKGLLPVSDDLEPYEVSLVVDSTYPSTDVNPAGQYISIYGSGFPASMYEVPLAF
jgi:hypothetical protein